jgi:hypothetical protein
MKYASGEDPYKGDFGIERTAPFGLRMRDHECDPDRCTDWHKYPDLMPCYNTRNLRNRFFN